MVIALALVGGLVSDPAFAEEAGGDDAGDIAPVEVLEEPVEDSAAVPDPVPVDEAVDPDVQGEIPTVGEPAIP
ncbi:hypothetical protein GCM10023152_13060 [Agromyces bauzanensis]|uniref:Uncharacterized protein n=2 Tax=Agromyces bauzanensis TaxID=1308924 RepID=A0A917PEU1_9MICO|nr:hypothetical protein GCM10011372_09890 [Agromyces bauzanensis]